MSGAAAHSRPGGPAVLGVVGWKNSGKTTLVARLVERLAADGLVVSTIKHAHVRFDIDHPGKDSFRHRQAGARQVAVVSPLRWALMHELRGAPEPALGEVLARLDPCDVVLVEGYKHDPHPKIEVRRVDARSHQPIGGPGGDPTVVAVACELRLPGAGLPVFALDDVDGLVGWLRGQGLLPG